MSRDKSAKGRRIVDKGDDGVQIMCDVCGKLAMSFRVGEFYGKEGLIFRGITHECAVPLEWKDRIYSWLRAGDLASVHEFVRSWVTMEDGLDAYCPECDKVYCDDHVRKEIEWDDGFYDCTYGTCPEGHRRIIDD